MGPGDVVAGRFVIEARAGFGGMGAVYKARDRVSGEAVALKILRTTEDGMDVRFAREQATLAKLVHPAIVRYVAHGALDDGGQWLAMEWLEGEDLSARLAREPLTLDEALRLSERIAEALGTAHARGIVHRDVKPGNVFLVDRDVDRARLLDFGLARIGGTTELTRAGMLVGTPAYMAPEQVRASSTVDARADVFSLGCILFRCVTGQRAFSGDAVAALLATILHDPAPSVRTLRADVPPELDALVDRMLSKDPALRPADGNAVARSLAAIRAAMSATTAAARAPHVPRRESLTTSERRFVCVLLARGGASERVDPSEAPTRVDSEVRDLAEARGARDAVRGLGADVELLADGTMIMTMAGAAAAHEQATRAARCALVLRARLPATPLVLATVRADTSIQRPVGAVTDRASGLLDRLGDGREDESAVRAIRLDETTAGLLEGAFDVRRDGAGVGLYGERGGDTGQRLLLGKPTPFVGRAREIATLGALLDECATEPVARIALVTGAPGVGKSRLRHEFLRAVRARGDTRVWIARGDPMTSQSPFGMVAQVVRRDAGLLDGEPLEQQRAKLRAHVARSVAAADAGRVAEFLGEIAGVPFDDAGRDALRHSRENAMARGDQMRRAWDDWAAAETEECPLVLVLEDLHWSDAASVRLIDGMMRTLAARPLLVVALARPEVRDAFPRLWSERGVIELPLAELTRRASEKLVRDVLGDVDAALVARLVDRAAGNAFYLEELIRTVAAGADALPDTLLAVAETRLQSLEADARRVLRAAAVFGQVFWRGGVEALLGGSAGPGLTGEWLDALAERELVTPREQARFPGEREYVFRNALLRDAVYATLTETDRALGHRLAAEWLTRAGEQDVALRARHFREGGDPARAVDLFARAAALALAANDFEGALAHAESAAAAGATGDTLGVVRLVQAEAARFRALSADSERFGLAAMDAFERGGPRWCEAVAEVASARHRLGDVAGQRELANEVLDVVRASGPSVARVIVALRLAAVLRYVGSSGIADELLAAVDADARAMSDVPLVTARHQQAIAARSLFEGDPAAYAESMRAAADAFERAGDLRSACTPRTNVGFASIELGRYEQAERELRVVATVAARLGLVEILAQCECNLGLALAQRGMLDEALSVETRALEGIRKEGYARFEGACQITLSEIHRLRGDEQPAEQCARAAVEALANAPPMRAHALAQLSTVLAARGRADEALAPAAEAMQILDASAGLETGESLVRLAYAEALAGAGSQDRAREVILAARERLLARAERIGDADSRASFLQRVPEHRRTLDLAGNLCGPP
jgi:tetratricopeptide (TPR) repeat protein